MPSKLGKIFLRLNPPHRAHYPGGLTETGKFCLHTDYKSHRMPEHHPGERIEPVVYHQLLANLAFPYPYKRNIFIIVTDVNYLTNIIAVIFINLFENKSHWKPPGSINIFIFLMFRIIALQSCLVIFPKCQFKGYGRATLYFPHFSICYY